MATATIQKTALDEKTANELKELICRTIREEFVRLWTQLLPYVSDEEQAELDEKFGSLEELRKGEFVDVTNRVAPFRKG